MVSRFARWYEEHPLPGDAFLAAALLVFAAGADLTADTGVAADLFHEPWFLALGLLVTAGALHHHRRTGGSDEARRRLAAITGAGTLALTAIAGAMVL